MRGLIPPVLVLCLNLVRTYLPLSKTKPSGLPNSWAFLVNVWFWSALTLTLNQRVWTEVSGGPPNLSNGCVETTRGPTGSLTLPQLCQHYMSLFVRIGKLTRNAINAHSCEGNACSGRSDPICYPSFKAHAKPKKCLCFLALAAEQRIVSPLLLLIRLAVASAC